MKDNIGRKGLVLGFIILFVGAGVIPSTVSVIEKKTTFTNTGSRGYIQDLIDNASDGDTIYIPSGTYYENIIINKSISLVGEDRDTTIIDGSYSGDVVYISSDWVNISGFTVKDGYLHGINLISNYNNVSGNIIILNNNCGINLSGDNNTINDNIISKNKYSGIEKDPPGYSNRNTITSNTLSNNDHYGIIFKGENNIIEENIITNNGNGVDLGGHSNIINCNNVSNNHRDGIMNYGFNSTISSNTISNNSIGLWLVSGNNNITRNTIINNEIGINIWFSYNNSICKNNFIKNDNSSTFTIDLPHTFSIRNRFEQNYWNRPRLLPKLILGKLRIYPLKIPWFNIDWRPALKPYDI